MLGKISRHHWKEHLKISKTATFESEASDDIAQQSCENLQTFVWWEGGWGNLCPPPRPPTGRGNVAGGGGRPPNLCPPPPSTQRSVKCRDLEGPYLGKFCTNHFQAWQLYSFQWNWRIFSSVTMSKVKKNRAKVDYFKRYTDQWFSYMYLSKFFIQVWGVGNGTLICFLITVKQNFSFCS